MPRVTFGRALKLAAAVLFASVALALIADDANAQMDSDGYVPVYYSCWAGGEVGLYTWTSDGYTTSGTITINQCLLDSKGAGPTDYQNVIAHEMGHSQGLGHSSDPYSTMYPTTPITGSRRTYVTSKKVRPKKK